MTSDGAAGQPRQAAMVFIFITILLDMLSLGIIIPVWPRLVVNFLAGDNARVLGNCGLAIQTLGREFDHGQLVVNRAVALNPTRTIGA